MRPTLTVVPTFAHKQPPDETWNSICEGCGHSVIGGAVVESADQLQVYDDQHRCEGSIQIVLAKLGKHPLG